MHKSMWISLGVCILLIIVTIMSVILIGTDTDNGMTISTYESFQKDKAYQMKLHGRSINQDLLEEMQTAYAKIPKDIQKYSTTEEYQIYARPYSAVFLFVRDAIAISALEVSEWKANEQVFYESYHKRLEARLEDEAYCLTENEKTYWKEQIEKLSFPIIFHYKEAYQALVDAMYTIALFISITIALTLCSCFSEEYLQKTDQLILCSKHGKHIIYWAKVTAGISVAFVVCFMITFVTFGTAFLVYGTEGFDAVFQLIWADYPYSFSVGEATLIAYGIVIISGIMIGAIVLFLSQICKNSTYAVGIFMAFTIVTMLFTIPQKYGIIADLWSFTPMQFLSVTGMFGIEPISLFGQVAPTWKIVPVGYLLISIIIVVLGKICWCYKKK